MNYLFAMLSNGEVFRFNGNRYRKLDSGSAERISGIPSHTKRPIKWFRLTDVVRR